MKLISDKCKLILLISFTCFFASSSRAQENPNLVDFSKNIIQQKESLYPFLDKMRLNKGNKLSIIHIGDSHIQADFFSGKLRETLQRQFGNAGRGLVFPYKFVQTNGPRDLKFPENTCNWKGYRIQKADSLHGIGIPGIRIELLNRNSCGFSLTFEDDSFTVSKGFDEVAVFMEGTATITLYDPQTTKEWLRVSDSLTGLTRIVRFKNSKMSTELIVTIDPNDRPMALMGLLLKKQDSGVFYHSMGVNGAMLGHFLSNNKFFTEIKSLSPDLLICSFGTNESYSKIDSLTFINQLDELHKYAQTNNTALLLTGPSDNYKKQVIKRKKKRVTTYVINDKAVEIDRWMSAYCAAKGIAYWSLLDAMGGRGNMKTWVEEGMAAKDHVHFSKKGYKLQAELLLDALLH